MQVEQPHPLFVTISGDLTGHLFTCRFHTLAPHRSAADLTDFAIKTVAFVTLQLHQAFPQSPLYFALGNNDSGCNDYHEDPDSPFLSADAHIFAADALNASNNSIIRRQFPHLGDYNIALPPPLHQTRLIVLQDIFESRKYTACNNAANPEAAAEQIAWLRAQLTAARSTHEHVWVMAHIPPGIDVYSTFAHFRSVCSGDQPGMFLASEALANTLADFPDVIRLALFGHTHMDEFRIFKTPTGDIPAKLVPSITPIDGNNPAFTLADVETSTATLKDYAVFSASNQTGISTLWSQEYRYSSTYNLPDLSGASLRKLTSGFLADHSGATAASHAYLRYFYVGNDGSATLSAAIKAVARQTVWPSYACSLSNATAATYRACVCPAAP